jgi:Beta-propeller repeat
MKNITITLALICFAIAPTFAQPSLQWASNFNAGRNDQGNDLVVDGSGNVYVAGTSDGANFFGDYFVAKYNPNGDTLWTRRHNGTANGIDEAYKIKIDPAGNVYVTGKSAATGAGYNIVTIKYNSSGIQQWLANFDAGNSGSFKDDIGLNMLIDIAGNVYVVGSSYKQGNNYSQGIAIKYNNVGMKQWHSHVGNISHFAKLIEQNTFGNLIVPTGRNNSSGLFIHVISPMNGAVLQTYSQGFYGTSYPVEMLLDPGGNIYLSSSVGNICATSNEFHTTKYAYAAPPQNPPSYAWDSWTYVNCFSAMLEGVAMKKDINYNLYVLADFFNGIKHNFYLKKYNANGATIWSFTQPSPTDDTPISLALGNLSDPSSPEIYVTGNSASGLIRTIKYQNDSTLL